jgi:hypothetical protein
MTSKKHRSFISAPTEIKKVTVIADIGVVYGAKLQKKGFKYAYIARPIFVT